jgi:hypothetical protein
MNKIGPMGVLLVMLAYDYNKLAWVEQLQIKVCGQE